METITIIKNNIDDIYIDISETLPIKVKIIDVDSSNNHYKLSIKNIKKESHRQGRTHKHCFANIIKITDSNKLPCPFPIVRRVPSSSRTSSRP